MSITFQLYFKNNTQNDTLSRTRMEIFSPVNTNFFPFVLTFSCRRSHWGCRSRSWCSHSRRIWRSGPPPHSPAVQNIIDSVSWKAKNSHASTGTRTQGLPMSSRSLLPLSYRGSKEACEYKLQHLERLFNAANYVSELILD